MRPIAGRVYRDVLVHHRNPSSVLRNREDAKACQRSITDASPGNLKGETTSNFRLQNSLENVQEFRVDSSNYPAEYGTGTGDQISVITKSGSNDWHGSAFEYVRNNWFDARNFFSGSQVDKLRLNQFGGSVGGRII